MLNVKQTPPVLYQGSSKKKIAKELLAELDAFLKTNGIAKELCSHDSAGLIVIIPDRLLWGNMASLISLILIPLQLSCKTKLNMTACNENFSAVNIRSNNIDELIKNVAEMFRANGDKLKMEFGIHSNKITVGIGQRRRLWGDKEKIKC